MRASKKLPTSTRYGIILSPFHHFLQNKPLDVLELSYFPLFFRLFLSVVVTSFTTTTLGELCGSLNEMTAKVWLIIAFTLKQRVSSAPKTEIGEKNPRKNEKLLKLGCYKECFCILTKKLGNRKFAVCSWIRAQIVQSYQII